MSRRKRLCLAWLALQLLLIVAFASRDTLQSIANGPTIVPSSLHSSSQKTESVLSTLLGQRLRTSNPYREAVATYANLAGIEVGYGYFGPNVPGTYKLTFELHYPDGHVDYALPQVSSCAAALRVSQLLDEIGQTEYEQLRAILVRMLAQSVWREHPEAKSISAVVEWIRLPSFNEFEHGKRESGEVLYTYDFTQTSGLK
jgi:hypothetical protein